MSRFHLLSAFLLGSGLAQIPAQSLQTHSTIPVQATPPGTLPGAIANKGATGAGFGALLSGGNDDCASASLILGTGPYFGDNVGATTDGPPACGSFGADVWYEWIAPSTGSTTVSLCNAGTDYDTTLAVYDGGCGSSLIGCNNDAVACLHGASFSSLTFSAVEGSSYRIRIGGASGATGDYEMRIVPAVQIGSDACATPDPVAGPGPHAFDLSVATTGAEGQANAACSFSSTTGIASDVWFTWTAPESGTTTIATCGQTGLNTKLAVYPGSGCPAGAPFGCNDDACAPQSSVTFSAVKGAAYTIQLGVFPGASPFGPGTFTITGPQPANACSYDDGVSEGHVGLGLFGEQAYLQQFGSPGDLAVVRSLSVAFGSPSDPDEAPSVGSLVALSIFDDPDDDGIPDDLVLLQTESSVVHGVDADLFAASAFTPSVLVDGVYFAAVSITSLPGDFPMAFDLSTPSGGRSWFVGEPGKGLNYSDLSSHTYFDDIADLTLDGTWLIRVDCEDLITPFCSPGEGGVLACPCGNPPSGPDRGCDNHGASSGGASLSGSGLPSLASDTLVLSSSGQNATAITIFWTGTGTNAPPGAIHGAGVRCVTGFKRIYTGPAAGGAISRPGGGDPSISARTAAVGAPITAGETRYYFTIYRDPGAAAACGHPAITINLSNAVAVLWVP